MPVTEKFIIDAKITLAILKTRVAVQTRLYSSGVEQVIRSHEKYPQLLAMRKDKNADRKKTATLVKKLLREKLKAEGHTTESFNEAFERQKKEYSPLQILIQAEKASIKMLKPQLKTMPVYAWMKDVKGLGDKYAIKLISSIRDIRRFGNPSKLRTYFGTAPGLRKQKKMEAHFVPEMKGVLLGQVAKNFLMNNSQYRRIYDEKKAFYERVHADDLEATEQKKAKKQKIVKEDWTKLRIHNYSRKAMMNRFVDELWRAWYLSEGMEPPVNPYIANDPKHNIEPMIVPVQPPID